jgi:hypothetical protein
MADFLPFLFFKNNPVSYKYQGRGGGGEPNIPARNRNQHSNMLLQQLSDTVNALQTAKADRQQDALPNRKGNYLKFEGRASYDLLTEQLENRGQEIRLLNVKESGENIEEKIISATIYVPEDREVFFRKKLLDYKRKKTKTGKYKHQSLVNSIENISLAALESLWTDNLDLIPTGEPRWCELWLNISHLNIEELETVKEACQLIDIGYKDQILSFPERKILLIQANKAQLEELVKQADFIAEIRLLKETARFWLIEKNIEQTAWVDDLLGRTNFTDNNTGVVLLDTGVNNGHRLLTPVVANADLLTANAGWGTNDHDGHGTLMAGILAYGNLQALLESQAEFEISHKITRWQ